MCGIVGIAGDVTLGINKVFRDLLIFDQLRGMDSTGVLGVGLGKDDLIVEKQVGVPNNLWEYNLKSRLFKDDGTIKGYKKGLLGHNRAATRGRVTVDNAHPFEFENIVGVHNGTIYDGDSLNNFRKYDVDSQALLAHIDQDGVQGAWESFIGAAALVWWDRRDETFNFLRNKERPLHYVKAEDGKTFLWASEASMLIYACARNDFKLEKHEDGKYKVWQFDENVHYKIKPSTAGYELTRVGEVKPMPPKPVIIAHTLTRIPRVSFKGRTGVDQMRSSVTPTGGWNASVKEQNRARKRWSANSKVLTWALGTERDEKDTKGLEFTVSSFGFVQIEGKNKEFFRGTFVDKEGYPEPLYIYPNSLDEYNALARLVGYPIVVLTTARLRSKFLQIGGEKARQNYCVSSQNIKVTGSDENIGEWFKKNPHPKTVREMVEEKKRTEAINASKNPPKIGNFDDYLDKLQTKTNEMILDKEDEIPFDDPPSNIISMSPGIYPSYGSRVAKGSLLFRLSTLEPSFCCSCCGNPINKGDDTELKSLYWYGSKAVACATCQSDPMISELIMYDAAVRS